VGTQGSGSAGDGAQTQAMILPRRLLQFLGCFGVVAVNDAQLPPGRTALPQLALSPGVDVIPHEVEGFWHSVAESAKPASRSRSSNARVPNASLKTNRDKAEVIGLPLVPARLGDHA